MIDPALDLLLRGALALLLASSALHKLSDVSTFEAVLGEYRLLPVSSLRLVALSLPAIEFALALGLLVPALRTVAAVAVFALFAAYSCAIAVNIARGRRHIDCGCGGPALRQPIGPSLLLRNAVLMAAVLVAALPLSARGLSGVDAVTIAGGIVAAAFLYQAAGYLMMTWPAHRRLHGGF